MFVNFGGRKICPYIQTDNYIRVLVTAYEPLSVCNTGLLAREMSLWTYVKLQR